MYKAIGTRIKQHRRKMELTQDMLARKANISLSFMGHIERGTRVMSIETLIKLAETLNDSADELLGLEVNAPHHLPPKEYLAWLLKEASIILDSME